MTVARLPPPVTDLRHFQVPHLCDQLAVALDPNHNHANPTIVNDTPRYFHRYYAAHKIDEYVRALEQDTKKMEVMDFEEKLNEYDKEDWRVISSIIVPKPDNMQKEMEQKKARSNAQKHCVDYLNSLMDQLPRMYYALRLLGDCISYFLLCSADSVTVRFIDQHSITPQGHSMATQSRPDLVAVHDLLDRQAPQPSNADDPNSPSPLSPPLSSPPPPPSDRNVPPGASECKKWVATSWANLESVVEFSSLGSSRKAGTEHAIGYSGYLFRARPDRVAVLGFFISGRDFSLILVDATGVFFTTLLWEDEPSRTLLLRVLYYIKKPPASMIDSTMKHTQDGAYIIDKKSPGYKLRWTGHPIGRRTVIYMRDDDAGDAGDVEKVCKDQFIHCAATEGMGKGKGKGKGEILEKTILDRIDGIPGVVRASWCGWIKRDDSSRVVCGSDLEKCQRIQLPLKDKGTPFMEVTNPYDALVIIWDLLEGD